MKLREYIRKCVNKMLRHFIRMLFKIKIFLTKHRKIVCVGILALVCGVISGSIIATKHVNEKVAKRIDSITEQVKEAENKVQSVKDESGEEVPQEEKDNDTTKLPWNLVLVNYNHPMEEGYEPELAELEPEYSVDVRIKDAAEKMLADAEAAGMDIIICSAYRSVNRQEQLFNETVTDRLNAGMNYWEAFSDARLSVAEPNTSEHALGLALDLISNEYTELDQQQERTKEAQWLAENCHKYGFILRYPPAKTDITRIIYEPWHYRYVGIEDATKIMEAGLTLEEYLETYE